MRDYKKRIICEKCRSDIAKESIYCIHEGKTYCAVCLMKMEESQGKIEYDIAINHYSES